MGYLCLNCFEEYDRDSLNLQEVGMYEYLCPKKNCNGSVVEIDDMILPIIKLLNQKGYETTFCCSAHSYNYENKPNTYISFDKECLPDTIPKGFILEDEEWYKKNYPKFVDKDKEDVCIRKYYGEDLCGYPEIDRLNEIDEFELHKEILKTMVQLMEWAEGLDDLRE